MKKLTKRESSKSLNHAMTIAYSNSRRPELMVPEESRIFHFEKPRQIFDFKKLNRQASQELTQNEEITTGGEPTLN